MNECTIFFVMQLPVPWPVKSQITLLDQSNQGQHLKIHAYTDGHISLENKSTINPFDYHIQPIKTAHKSMVVFSVTWSGQDIKVRLNGVEMLPFSPDVETANIPSKPVEEQDFELSIHHVDARKNCELWTKWRSNHFAGTQREARENRRSKTIDEQLIELEDELQALEELSEQVRAGKNHMLTKVAGSLRALIYWQEKNGKLVFSYNPLLLRMAGRLELPLPIFTLPPDQEKITDIISDINLYYSPDKASLTKDNHLQVILDFQEWLMMEVGEIYINSINQKRTLTRKDVILEAANTLGGSHFDEDIPIGLDVFKSSNFLNKNFLSSILLNASDVVCGLGEYVITASLGARLSE